MTTWGDAQEAETAWWGTCQNTYDEETMQLIMAAKMGLAVQGAVITAAGTIADIGGGPVSLLLKTQGWLRAMVVDPAIYPTWTRARYGGAGIEVIGDKGEDFLAYNTGWLDEVWVYNTLQHVDDPEAIVVGACRSAGTVRIFEWIGFETNDCHIHTLDGNLIRAWAMGTGVQASSMMESISWAGGEHLSFHGVFTRD